MTEHYAKKYPKIAFTAMHPGREIFDHSLTLEIFCHSWLFDIFFFKLFASRLGRHPCCPECHAQLLQHDEEQAADCRARRRHSSLARNHQKPRGNAGQSSVLSGQEVGGQASAPGLVSIQGRGRDISYSAARRFSHQVQRMKRMS